LSDNVAVNVGHEGGAGNFVPGCPNELFTPTSAYRTTIEDDDSGDSYGEPNTTTAKARPCTPHPRKNRKSVRLKASWMKLGSSSSDDDVNRFCFCWYADTSKRENRPKVSHR